MDQAIFVPSATTPDMRSPFHPVSWEQRTKGVLPMPGGYDGYLNTLRSSAFTDVNDLKPTSSELARRCVDDSASLTLPVD